MTTFYFIVGMIHLIIGVPNCDPYLHGILSGKLSGKLSDIFLTFYLASYLTYILKFYLIYTFEDL